MHEEATYATFPPAPYTSSSSPDVLPGAIPQQHSTADFDAIKRSFEAASLAAGAGGGGGEVTGGVDKKQRYASATTAAVAQPFVQANAQAHQPQPQPHQQQPSPSLGYGDVYGSAGAPSFTQNGLFGQHFATAPPFVPASQQSQGGYSGPGSPYLGSPNPSGIPFGSPASQNGQPPQAAASYNGSSYSGPYDTMPSSPNPYAGNPYAATFGSPLGYGGQFLMPGMLGMGLASPQLGLQQFPMGFPMMNQASLGMNAQTVHSGRTVYVGNLPSDASVDELLNQVRFGPIDSVKILPEKSCAFISFLDGTTAAAFHSDALMRKVRLHDQDLKIGWGKPSSVPANIVMAVQQSGATRNVYLGNLDESMTEQSLRDDLSRFGPIDQVKIVRDRAIAFVHFLSIATAIKVVQALATEPEWAGRRVNFGKDRCAYVPKNQHQQQQHNMAAAAMGSLAASYGGFGGMVGFSPALGGLTDMMAMNGMNGMQQGVDPNHQPGNRTIYLGNIHPETTTEEICNTIRGGILQQIRYIPDKHICFVTFVDASCALAFYQTATYQGIALHNRRLKIGWGKNSGPTPPGIAMVVQSGGSRNVYIGNIEDFDTYNEERLRKDFGEYGEIELVNSLPIKNASFVNFTNIANAIKAIEGMKQHPDYATLRISYGKDRCGGTPKHGFPRGSHHQQNGHPNGFAEQGLGLIADPQVYDQNVPEYNTSLDGDLSGGVGALAIEEASPQGST